jgi:dethiobiotin synthetase
MDIYHHSGLFITGTDTNIGKTWVGIQLIQALKQQGRHIDARKPVESGWQTDINQTDAWQLAQAADNPLDQVCHYRLTTPLAPPRAATLENLRLTLGNLTQACYAHHQQSHLLYVEGAGGFYSPIAHDGLNADLAQKLNLPIILISENRLGCINHILLIAEAIAHRQLNLAGVILNTIQPLPNIMDNAADLANYLTAPIIVW